MLLHWNSQANLLFKSASNSNSTNGHLPCANAKGTPHRCVTVTRLWVAPFRHGRRHGTSQPLGAISGNWWVGARRWPVPGRRLPSLCEAHRCSTVKPQRRQRTTAQEQAFVYRSLMWLELQTHPDPWAGCCPEKGDFRVEQMPFSMTKLGSNTLVLLLVLSKWCAERFLYLMALLHGQKERKKKKKKEKEKHMFYVKFMLFLQQWSSQFLTPRASRIPFQASLRVGIIKASSHDSCFHLVSFQVGQAGAGEGGMLASVTCQECQPSCWQRIINCKARGIKNTSVFYCNIKEDG